MNELELAETERKNHDFVQVKKSDLILLTELAGTSLIAHKMLMMLVQTMNKENVVIFSQKAMQQELDVSRPTIDRAIKLLKNDLWVQVIKIGSVNAYVMNSSVFWTGRRDKKLGVFSAQVVTTLAEQDRDLREKPSVKLKRFPLVIAPERPVILDDTESQKELDV